MPGETQIHELPFQIQVDARNTSHPKEYDLAESNFHLRVLEVQPVEPVFAAVPVAAGDPAAEKNGPPALHFVFSSARMNQRMEEWLAIGDAISPGPIEFRFQKDMPPTPVAQPAPPTPGAKVRSMEKVYVFRNSSPNLLKTSQVGPDSGMTAVFKYDEPQDQPAASLALTVGGHQFTFPVLDLVGKETPLEGTAYALQVEKIFRNLHVAKGGVVDDTGPANNPAVLIRLFGPMIDAPAADAATPAANPHGTGMGEMMNQRDLLTFYMSDDHRLFYWAKSPRHGEQTGLLTIGKPLSLGWADFQITVDHFYPHSRRMVSYHPIPEMKFDRDKLEGFLPGLHCEVEYNGTIEEVWIGQQSLDRLTPQSVVCNGKTVNLEFMNQTADLGFGVELVKFEVPKDEGTSNPMDWKATLRMTDGSSPADTQQISMNNPCNFPNTLLAPYLGTSYKFSQASADPSQPTYSGVQVLRDPGWMPKWVGAIMIVFGIFTMFYLKPYFRPRPATSAAKPSPLAQTQSEQHPRHTRAGGA